MLGFLIGVSLAIFILGTYLIYKHLKEKKSKKKLNDDEELPFDSFDKEPKE